MAYRSYVAIGDSLSEGLGDFSFDLHREHNGWTDRLAGMLSLAAHDRGHNFYFANLALRGSKLRTIMTSQLESALRLQPDLVTIMAGSNDFMASAEDVVALELIFKDGLRLLKAAGCDVVVATTIRPIHLRVFRRLLPRADRMSAMIKRVAGELQIPVVDVHGIHEFSQLEYWIEDMVHFSGHGHIKVANLAAKVLGLPYRMPEAQPNQIDRPRRGFIATAKWVALYVVPFIKRKLRGRTSGDGMTSKHLGLVPFAPIDAFDIQPISMSRLSLVA